MTTGLYKCTEHGYYPANSEAVKTFMADKKGSFRNFTTKNERNPKFNAKFNAMIDLVAANQERIKFTTKKQGNERLKYAACYMLKLGEFWGNENQHFTRKSFSFNNMKEDEFAEVYDQFLDLYLQHFVPMGKEDFKRELEGFL